VFANVYIADSDSTVGNSIQFLLASDNISARVFTGGLELLACTRDVPPGCIVAEALLPDISALSLLDRLRCDGLQVPVIILSSSGDVFSALEASRTGAWDYLQKPFMQSRLLDSVHRAMRQTH
jgi:FixJ family two-component response regulator